MAYSDENPPLMGQTAQTRRMPNRPREREVVEAVTCRQCWIFQGLITSDGKGPEFSGCSHDPEHFACPMKDKLAPYAKQVDRKPR